MEDYNKNYIKYNITLSLMKDIDNWLNFNNILLIKFSADWCKPCKKIKHVCDKHFNKMIDNNNIIIVDVNIDNNIDLFFSFKKFKMLKGVPSILAFFGDNKNRYKWYIPDDSVSGSNEDDYLDFFKRCNNKIIK